MLDQKGFVKIAVCMLLAAVLFVGVSAVMADDDARPGEKDPVTTNRHTLFRDDELAVLYTIPSTHHMDYLFGTPENDDLTSWEKHYDSHNFHADELDTNYNDDMRPIASARGRTLDHKRDYVVYAFFRPDGQIAVEQYDPGNGRRTHWIKRPGSTTMYRSLDIAVGDLDCYADENGWYHDEIVLVRTDVNRNVIVDVFDGNLDLLAGYMILDYPDHSAHYTAVDVGDLNGDGYPEIVVGMYGEQDHNQINVLTFRNDHKTAVEFTNVSTYSKKMYDSGGYDLAVGDFDGNGKDEIVCATGAAGTIMSTLRADDDLNLHHAHDMGTSGDTGVSGTLRIVKGLFKYDGGGWSFNRRQAAVCYATDHRIICRIYEIHSDLKITQILTHQIDLGSDAAALSIDVAAGNFVGHGVDKKKTSPLTDLAVSYVKRKRPYPETVQPRLHILSVRSGGLSSKWSWHGNETNEESGNVWQMGITVSAADADGDTYRLGAPAHIVMQDVMRVDRIIQEPPKHVDYLPLDYNDPEGDWDIVNVSAWTDFAITLKDERETTLETETKRTSSWTIGGDAELDVKGSVEAGDMDVAGVKASAEVKTKLGYDYERNKSTYNSQYYGATCSEESETNNDDILHGIVHTIDVWRYPILGYYDSDTPDKPYGYQEIIMPGPYTLIDKASGKDHPDWYQPVHENHNVLSYPFYDQYTDWKPDDLGSFEVTGNPDSKNIVMNDNILLYWNGQHYTREITWSSRAGSGSSKEYNNTLSESVEITASVEAKAKLLFGSVESTVTGTVGFHNSNSWGGETVADSTNSATTGISIEIPKSDVVSDSSYSFKPAGYITSTGGAFKVAHSVTTPGGDWWIGQYGRKPDPALNLPNRFTYHVPHGDDLEEYWTLNDSESRKKMRGFFLRKSEEDPDTGEYPLLSDIVTDGETVRLCARVYNYSLNEGTGDFQVRFYYYPWDAQHAEQVAEPVTQTSMVGTISLDALTTSVDNIMQEVCVNWDTTGLSNAYTNDDNEIINTFRFLVFLDEPNAVDEKHELYNADGSEVPGTNNIGSFPWTNGVSVSNGAESAITENPPHSQNDLRMSEGSLAVKTEQGIVRTDEHGDPLKLILGETYSVRALLQSDFDHPFYRLAFLYSGHPAEEGGVIGSSMIYGVEATDTYVWYFWTPDELGEQEIWAKVLEDPDEENRGNAIDSLTVNVVERDWNPAVDIRLNQTDFRTGDAYQVLLSASSEYRQSVDAWFAVQIGSDFLFWPTLQTDPLSHRALLPEDFTLTDYALMTATVDAGWPRLEGVWYAAFTRPDTMEIVAIDSAAFRIVD